MSAHIRRGARADAAEINRIYNHYALRTTVTFDIAAWDLARREKWIAEFAPPHFLLAAEIDTAESGNALAGFAFNRAFRAKPGYARSTEVTIYTDAARRIPGAAHALYENLFAHIARAELHRAYAVIALPNARSVAFHEKFGFRHIGTLREVGHKFGRYVDTAWFEKVL